jgi:hypothetical protein
MELDLHGIKHEDVDRLLENFVYLNQYEMPLTVICGNSARMMYFAKLTLDRIGCRIYEPRFGIIIILGFNL